MLLEGNNKHTPPHVAAWFHFRHVQDKLVPNPNFPFRHRPIGLAKRFDRFVGRSVHLLVVALCLKHAIEYGLQEFTPRPGGSYCHPLVRSNRIVDVGFARAVSVLPYIQTTDDTKGIIRKPPSFVERLTEHIRYLVGAGSRYLAKVGSRSKIGTHCALELATVGAAPRRANKNRRPRNSCVLDINFPNFWRVRTQAQDVFNVGHHRVIVYRPQSIRKMVA
mmetsp:Transcript_4690/g.11231  ORF Transcript_4690/g.11231 Transcript_4690/m.11231 type:complete len:220 (-) Transcript_4690:274-933(-)